MIYTYTLSNEIKQLIRTTSPVRILDLDAGIYAVGETLKNTLRDLLWLSIDEYTGILSLEVSNG